MTQYDSLIEKVRGDVVALRAVAQRLKEQSPILEGQSEAAVLAASLQRLEQENERLKEQLVAQALIKKEPDEEAVAVAQLQRLRDENERLRVELESQPPVLDIKGAAEEDSAELQRLRLENQQLAVQLEESESRNAGVTDEAVDQLLALQKQKGESENKIAYLELQLRTSQQLVYILKSGVRKPSDSLFEYEIRTELRKRIQSSCIKKADLDDLIARYQRTAMVIRSNVDPRLTMIKQEGAAEEGFVWVPTAVFNDLKLGYDSVYAQWQESKRGSRQSSAISDVREEPQLLSQPVVRRPPSPVAAEEVKPPLPRLHLPPVQQEADAKRDSRSQGASGVSLGDLVGKAFVSDSKDSKKVKKAPVRAIKMSFSTDDVCEIKELIIKLHTKPDDRGASKWREKLGKLVGKCEKDMADAREAGDTRTLEAAAKLHQEIQQRIDCKHYFSQEDLRTIEINIAEIQLIPSMPLNKELKYTQTAEDRAEAVAMREVRVASLKAKLESDIQLVETKDAPLLLKALQDMRTVIMTFESKQYDSKKLKQLQQRDEGIRKAELTQELRGVLSGGLGAAIRARSGGSGPPTDLFNQQDGATLQSEEVASGYTNS
jgi:hypothetical protein